MPFLSNMLTSRAWWWGLAPSQYKWIKIIFTGDLCGALWTSLIPLDFIERDTRMGFFLVQVLDQTWLDEKPVQRLMCQERRGRKQQFLWLTQIEALPPPQRAHAIICKSTLRWHKTSIMTKSNRCTHPGLCSVHTWYLSHAPHALQVSKFSVWCQNIKN